MLHCEGGGYLNRRTFRCIFTWDGEVSSLNGFGMLSDNAQTGLGSHLIRYDIFTSVFDTQLRCLRVRNTIINFNFVAIYY